MVSFPRNAFFSDIRKLLGSVPTAFPIYLVGGCVRDMLLAKDPDDYDVVVATSEAKAYADHLAQKCRSRTVVIGKEPDIVYRIPCRGALLDVIPMIGESIQADLWNRDFTANALAIDLQSAVLIDVCGGVSDIESRTIRMVSEEAFQNDPLRMLRAYRIAAQIGFTIDPNTLAAISRHASAILSSAAERIRVELFKLLRCHRCLWAIRSMADNRLLGALFPEIEACRGCTQNRYHRFDVLDHSLMVFSAMETAWTESLDGLTEGLAAFVKSLAPSERAWMKLAALLHDIGKPVVRTVGRDGAVHFYEHEAVGADMARAACIRLKCPNRETESVATLIRHHLRPFLLFDADRNGRLTRRGIARFLMASSPFVRHVLFHAVADHLGKADWRLEPGEPHFLAFIGQLDEAWLRSQERQPEQAAHPRLLTGDDLIRHLGLRPSERFRQLLDAVEEARLAEEIHSREEALDFVSKLLREM
ncbi:MAG: HD domain-containing protein [Thermodesulfobacteriota bacterium]